MMRPLASCDDDPVHFRLGACDTPHPHAHLPRTWEILDVFKKTKGFTDLKSVKWGYTVHLLIYTLINLF